METALTFEEFVEVYNGYIDNWLQEEISKKEQELEKADVDARNSLNKEVEKLKFRRSLGGYFRFRTEEDLPDSLVWEDGMEYPDIGDPDAIKGGTLNYYEDDFPLTIRKFGLNSGGGGFRGILYDSIDLGLVGLHPDNSAIIPALADRWAVSEDKRTVYFHIDSEARFSNGEDVTSRSFAFALFVRLSDYVDDAYAKQYFREQYAQVSCFGKDYIAVTLPQAKPMTPYFANLYAAPEAFYKEYGPDFEERYQWRFVPTTGAYVVKDSDLIKGVSITQTRVQDWWAKDKKYYRYRFNPDAIKYTVIRDDSKAFEYFRAGQLDYFPTTRPELWYEKTEIPEVFNGYIHKATFYNDFPRRPYGFYLNTHQKKLKDVNFRIGLHHSINWQKIINTVYRGDYARLNQYSDGFGRFTDESIKAREFSIVKAREAFAKAGYVGEDQDGYLINGEREKLSITITYGNIPQLNKILSVLRDEARTVGLDLILDPLEGGVFYKKIDDKSYDMVLLRFGTSPPFPRYFQLYHSSNAYDSEGNPKKSTNNVFSIADDKLDLYSENIRNATTVEEIEENAKNAQRRAHELALFIPSFTTDFFRVSYWRWLKWPDSEYTQFCPRATDEPSEWHVYWIDQDLKKATLEAKRKREKLPEVVTIYDKYRNISERNSTKGGENE